tara:strand:- start:628 stop:1395 length:768 start_codon:yes stop_codon:yes gene_type:complete
MSIKEYNYEKFAEYYDILELENPKEDERLNDFIDRILKNYKVKTVLDITCGTGAQTIGLKNKGYKITASDLSKGMLKIAKEKAKDLDIKFYQGDMRTVNYGKFDAVISMFNAIGHLDQKGLEQTIRNVGNNLNDKGIYIFDIFNQDFMDSGGFIGIHEFIDKAKEFDGKKFVRFNKNTYNSKKGIIHINQRTLIQENMNEPKELKEIWDMKIYTINKLKTLLDKNGFKTMETYGGVNQKFQKKKSLSIYIVAKKK